ncbi:MAG: hypothetical protein A2172_02890 [Candidatus Woykebacteria bacterium RBG_13_40_15]|uniref:Glycosyltransferase subfamily 4-like N-terminal domain-containing protein n=1 Tax=Candidatus Woykebacteria bacterium RBG_13_40_15 TaxID=1802593 RepID=A0A1G1W5A0_9BACT|nr:MAG: hypothetical protein A2172_02890 [Candidatus Woykebacteria bacterium RBG_13_40_15]
MRIGQVSISYKPILGGQEVYLDNLSKILKDNNHTIHVYQPDMGVDDPELFLTPNPNNPTAFQKLIPRLMRYNFLLLTHQLSNLRKEDLLIIHYPEHYLPVFWHKKTLVLTHGINWDFDPTAKKFQRKALAKLAFKFAWKFVANDTNFLRAMGVDIRPKEKMFQEVLPGRWFIPNCADTELFTKTAGIRELKKLNPVIVPRNFSKARGVDLAVDAFELIASKEPSLNLVIVGSNLPVPDSLDYGEQLLFKVKSSKFRDRIVFFGSKPWREMRDVYSSAVATLIPTRGNEGTSLAALESMSCGTATVTTSVAGLKDLPSVQIPPKPAEIAKAILNTIRNKDKIGIDQQKEVRGVYNIENWKNAWLKVIN